jgi:uncharacterized repeat protein (TIGR01451 family)
LRLRKIGPTQAQQNDIVPYRLEVANVGRTRLRNVVLTDALPEGVEAFKTRPNTQETNPLIWALGDLAPGQTREVQYEAILKKVEPGDLVNKVIAEATGGVRVESSHTLRVGIPGASLLFTGPFWRLVGRPATYHVTVTNPGSSAATNVTVSDELVKELEFVEASDRGRFEDGQVRWNLGTLPAGARRTLSVTVKSRFQGRFTNVVTLTADRGLEKQSKVVTRFYHPSGLDLEIVKNPDPVEVGQETTLTIRLLNTGKAAETRATASLTVPEELAIVKVEGGNATDTTVRLGPLDRLEPGGEASVVVRVRAKKAGEVKVRATATSDRVKSDKAVETDDTLLVIPPSSK